MSIEYSILIFQLLLFPVERIKGSALDRLLKVDIISFVSLFHTLLNFLSSSIFLFSLFYLCVIPEG